MSELAKLTETLHLFMQENAKAALENAKMITRLDVNQGHLTKAFQEMGVAVMSAIESNTRLEVKIESLEEKSLDKIELMEDSLNEIGAEVKIIDKRTHTLEMLNANKQGEDKANNQWKNRITANWFNVVIVIVMLFAIVSPLSQLVKDADKKPTTITKDTK